MAQSKKIKKVLSLVMSAAVLGSTVFTGLPAQAAQAEDSDLLISNKEVTGSGEFIENFQRSDYTKGGRNGFEVTFEYTKIGTLASDNTLGFNDSLQFVVYDAAYNGWNPTKIGPTGYDLEEKLETVEPNTKYTVKVPFSDIESKLSTGGQVMGINIQTGGIGDSVIKIDSLKYTVGTVESKPVVIEGAWKKTSDPQKDFGSLSVTEGNAYVTANEWNVLVSGFSVAAFKEPTVAVTVEYEGIGDTPIYPQSEILNAQTYEPLVPNYPQISKDGEVTHLTKLEDKSIDEMVLAFDTGTVKKVEIYDAAEDKATQVTDLTNATIVKAMGAGWNLGNALDSVDDTGATGETLWGNPEISKRLFKVIAASNIKTVRIPVTWVDAVSVNGASYEINESRFNAILNRVQEVVDMARAYDLFVIINIQHDGGEGITNRWLDVAASNQTGIRRAFTDVWTRIAQKFADYDQHLIFESMNEVMESGNYGMPSATTYRNINTLNQNFVTAVRGQNSAANQKRFLMVPGYNTNIDATVADNGFVMPAYNESTEYEIVSVHFYDPYNFTLNEGSDGTTKLTDSDLQNIDTQFDKLKTKFIDKGIPVVVGEFAAVDKNNYSEIARYISKVVESAKSRGIGYAYWDNGYTGSFGMGLWDRYTYGQTTLGKTVIPLL